MTADGQRAPTFFLRDERDRPISVPQPGISAVLVFYRGDW